ncbi:recombinase RecA, partial [Streptomyces sp. DT225]
LKDNPDLANEIEKKILVKLGVGVRPEDTAESGTDAAGAAAPADAAAKPVTATAGKTKPAKAAAAKS